MTSLPVALDHEPLVDVVFEVRMNDTLPLADILPGFLRHEFGPETIVNRLPAAEIPYPMRKEDTNLRFAPVQHIKLEKYSILVGDKNVMVNCHLPYPKWPNFRPMILDVMARIAKIRLPGFIERYSVKYVNLIQAPTLESQISKIKTQIQLGYLEVKEENISLKVHQIEGDVVHILSIDTGARGQIEGKEVSGVLVDIDSIRNTNSPDFQSFAASLEEGLENLRQSNKEKFFNCLKQETIQELGPTYE